MQDSTRRVKDSDTWDGHPVKELQKLKTILINATTKQAIRLTWDIFSCTRMRSERLWCQWQAARTPPAARCGWWTLPQSLKSKWVRGSHKLQSAEDGRHFVSKRGPCLVITVSMQNDNSGKDAQHALYLIYGKKLTIPEGKNLKTCRGLLCQVDYHLGSQQHQADLLCCTLK